MNEGGLAAFYNSGMFADYPPGYMYVLYITSGIAKLLGLSYASAAYALITKMPGILADIVSAYVVYRLAKSLRRAAVGMLRAGAGFRWCWRLLWP